MQKIKQLKQIIREQDYTGDRWGVVMSLMFDLCELGYEVCQLPPEWEFSPGAMGNIIDRENNIFCLYQIEFTPDNTEMLIDWGNYLNRLEAILRKAGHSY